ncbi:MAG: MFS transporter, partial [Gaiellaceae bacterium]
MVRLREPGMLAVACVAICLTSFTLGTVAPLLPHFKEQMHSSLYAALVVAGHPIGSLLAAVPTLLLSRRVGLPRVIVAGGAIASVASVPFIWPGAGWWIVLARVGFGFSATMVWQSVFAWAIVNTGMERRARTIGVLTGASTAGMLAGPQLGALAAHFGVWLCALPPLLLLLVATRFGVLPRYEMLERADFTRVRGLLASRDAVAGLSLTSTGAIVGLGTAVAVPLALGDRGVGAFGIGAVLTAAYAVLVFGNPLAGAAADRGWTRMLVVGDLALLTVVFVGLRAASAASAAVPLALGAVCLVGMPMLAGNVLLSRAAAAASLDQTLSQTLATLAWAPAAIVGSTAVGAISSSGAALV